MQVACAVNRVRFLQLRLGLALALGNLALGVAPVQAAARRAPRIVEAALDVQVRVRIARCDGKLLSEDIARAQTESAQRIFAGYGVNLKFTFDTFTPERCAFLNADERDAGAQYVEPFAPVTVLLVEQVQDLEQASYFLRGVHWHYRNPDKALERHWIFLSQAAKPPVLAHELGHFFGLPHDPAGKNLMAPGPSSPGYKKAKALAPVLTRLQAALLRQGVRAYLRQTH